MLSDAVTRSLLKRLAEPRALVLAALCAVSAGCGARSDVAVGFDASAPDASDASVDDAPDARLPDAGVECPEQFVTIDWRVDGAPGSSECVPAQGIVDPVSRGSDPRCDPHLEVNFFRIESVEEGLPLDTRTFAVAVHNMPLATGASGSVEPWSLQAGPLPCREERVGAYLLLATGDIADYVSGTWHVLEGGGAREWVDFELRDVVYDDVGGHRVVLDRVHYHVRLYDPALGP